MEDFNRVITRQDKDWATLVGARKRKLPDFGAIYSGGHCP